MIPPRRLLRRLEDIGASIASTNKALALMGLGSVGVERRAMMSVPDYVPELDWGAVASNGRLAGFCVCGIPVKENAVTGRSEGYADPTGVHPDFQKKVRFAKSL